MSNAEAVRKYNKTNKGEVNRKKRFKKFKDKNPNYHRDYNLMYKYGITIEQYNQMFKEQKGCCRICGRHQTEVTQKLNVDHCHVTGKVRGLLCWSCNHKLGWFENNRDNVIEYLRS